MEPTTQATHLTDILYGVGHLLILSQVLGQGLPRLLQYRRGADVDFRHNHRDRDLDCKTKRKKNVMVRSTLGIHGSMGKRDAHC